MRRFWSIFIFTFGPLLLAAQTVEVRYDLGLIASFDGIGTTYSTAEEIELSPPGASSTLSGRYGTANLVDDDPTTAWFEGENGYGVGETISFDVSVNAIPRVIAIWPGYQRSGQLYERNGRPARVLIRWIGFDPSREDRFFEIAEVETNLIRSYDGRVAAGPQYIHIGSGPFVQNAEVSELAILAIDILEVDSDGSTDPDTGISEIKLYAEGRTVGVRAPGY